MFVQLRVELICTCPIIEQTVSIYVRSAFDFVTLECCHLFLATYEVCTYVPPSAVGSVVQLLYMQPSNCLLTGYLFNYSPLFLVLRNHSTMYRSNCSSIHLLQLSDLSSVHMFNQICIGSTHQSCICSEHHNHFKHSFF